MTIDTALLKLVNSTNPVVEELVPGRDAHILKSLATGITNNMFLTEKQGSLLLTILENHIENISKFHTDIIESLKTPAWSKKFRHVEQIKKIIILLDAEGDPYISIEFSPNAQIRKKLNELSKLYNDIHEWNNGKIFRAELTERNIVILIDHLKKFNFDITEKLLDYYKTIKSWSEVEIQEQFLITNITNASFQNNIATDLGMETNIDQNTINDRSIRYQYFTQNPKNPGETLVEYIANRSRTRVYVDKNQHSLSEIIASLQKLRRLPLLMVLDGTTDKKYYDNLEMIANALDNNNIDNNVGVYFRLSNDESGKKFNELVKQKQYNQRLDNDLQVAILSSGKLPKFFLTSDWKPMSVIAVDTQMGLRHGKLSTYAQCCDLVIEWCDNPIIFDQKKII